MSQTTTKAAVDRDLMIRAVCLGLVVITLGLYWQVKSFEFNNYDDAPYITENPNVQQGLTAASIKWAFTTGYFGTWHPLTWLSHLLDVQMYGLNAGSHHFTSVLIHTASAVLLFLLVLRWTDKIWPSAFVAGLFAWHPMHVESVAWVAERKDVLSALFWMLTLFAYTKYANGFKVSGSKFKVYYVLALILFALGLMSKPMLVSLPLILLLLDFWPLKRIADCRLPIAELKSGNTASIAQISLVRACLEKLPFIVLSAAACVITFIAQKGVGAVENLEHYTFGERVANALASYVAYLGKLIWPVKLAVLYPYVHNLPLGEVLGAAVLLAAITALAVRLRKTHPVLLVGWFWYVITLLPVIGLVQVGEQAMADRYSYIPSIGLFLIAALELPPLIKAATTGPMALPLGTGALTICGFISAQQIGYWRNSIALWSHAVEVTTNNATAECNLGGAFNRGGQFAEGIAHERAALKIKPDYTVAQNNLGGALGSQGQYEEAVKIFQAAIKSNPKYDRSYYNLGLACMNMGRMDEAVPQFQTFIKMNSQYAPAYASLGHILAQQGHVDEAIAQYHKALALAPNYPYAQNGLAEALAAKK